MIRALATFLSITLVAQTAQAADLVRFVRNKISAGDLASPMAMIEDHKNTTGIDNEYLDAVGWVARGAEMLNRPDIARQFVAELHREIPEETVERLIPYGAAIEVEGRLLAASDGRGAAIRYLQDALAKASAPALRSRISKNINMLGLEGQPAPPLEVSEFIGPKPATLAALRGKPVLLFLWAEWCGDCKGSAPSLTRVWQKYGPRGLQVITATRLYGGPPDKPMTPEQERAQVEKVWKETYAGLAGIPIILSTDTMVRYGASATPTFALIDRKGIVRLYAPTRLSETELSRRVEEVLAEESKP